MQIKPTRGKLLIKQVTEAPEEDKKIISVKYKREVQKSGEVVAVGAPEMDKKGKEHPLNVRPGDIVYFMGYKNMNLGRNKIEYIFLRQADVLAIKKERE